MTAKDELWTFALAFYACPGVAPACLRCQDEGGADVNTLLFALWQASAGAAVTTEVFQDIEQETLEWRREVVQKLRAIRRHLKPAGGELRDLVKSAELEAERQELQALAEFVRYSTQKLDCVTAAQANLAAYQAAAGLDVPADVLEALLAAFATALQSGFRA